MRHEGGADPFDRRRGLEPLGVADRGRVAEEAEAFLCERIEDVVLAGEVAVDGGGAVLDPFGDLANGNVVEALGDKEFARRVEDRPADRLAVPFVSFFDSHGCPEKWDLDVRVQPQSYVSCERCSRA